ncbi:MAG: hypothetical protein JO102_02310, partial [Elusimicrobia bacterium]|nr:hypothetical protein [Elusimicrobiota bacterium]
MSRRGSKFFFALLLISLARAARAGDVTQTDYGNVGYSVSAAGGARPSSGGSADALLFSGSFLYTVPIEVPPGVNGLAPSVSLRYISNGPLTILSPGWDVSFGSIQRSTKNGPPSYSGADTFVLT